MDGDPYTDLGAQLCGYPSLAALQEARARQLDALDPEVRRVALEHAEELRAALWEPLPDEEAALWPGQPHWATSFSPQPFLDID